MPLDLPSLRQYAFCERSHKLPQDIGVRVSGQIHCLVKKHGLGCKEQCCDDQSRVEGNDAAQVHDLGLYDARVGKHFDCLC